MAVAKGGSGSRGAGGGVLGCGGGGYTIKGGRRFQQPFHREFQQAFSHYDRSLRAGLLQDKNKGTYFISSPHLRPKRRRRGWEPKGSKTFILS